MSLELKLTTECSNNRDKIRSSGSVNAPEGATTLMSTKLHLYGRHCCCFEEFNDLVSHLETNFGEDGAKVVAVIYFKIVHLGYYWIKELQPILTYTQAMSDKGELPSVGMECLAMIDSS